MLKFLFILSIFIVTVNCASVNISRIAQGVPAVKGENLDFVTLKVVFQNQFQICGGVLIAKNLVLTSGTCVYDVAEDDASDITVNFPGNPKIVGKKLNIFKTDDYEEAMQNVQDYLFDLAIIQLRAPVTPDDKTIKIAKLELDETFDYTGANLRACGLGSTANKPTPPKSLMCTNFTVVDSSLCESSNGQDTICTLNSDSKNLCNGDYGTPLYKYSYSGKVITQSVVAIASNAPNLAPNSPCLGGHMVEFTRLSSYSTFITAIKTAYEIA